VKRVVVTGGTGFVGANLARRCLREGHEVHLLVRRGHDPWRVEELRRDVTIHEADLADRARLAAVAAAIRPDWVFHLAVAGAYSWQTDAGEMVRTNVAGTINMVEAFAAAGFEAFVNAGTSSEYGPKDHAPAEDEPVEPDSSYAVTKVCATLWCRHAARARGLRIPTLRLYSAYGPWEEPRRLVPALVVKGLRGGLPPLAGAATARDFVHVDDVAEAFLAAAAGRPDDPGAVYNVGTGVQTTIEEAVARARDLLGIAAEPRWGTMPARSWDTTVWVADNRRIARELGWRPWVSFADGLARTVEWFRSRTDMVARYEKLQG